MKMSPFASSAIALVAVIHAVPLPLRPAGLIKQLYTNHEAETYRFVKNELSKRGVVPSFQSFFKSINKGMVLPMNQKTLQRSIWGRKPKVAKPMKLAGPNDVPRSRFNPHVRPADDVRNIPIDDVRNIPMSELYYKAPSPTISRTGSSLSSSAASELSGEIAELSLTPVKSMPVRAGASLPRSKSWPSSTRSEGLSNRLREGAFLSPKFSSPPPSLKAETPRARIVRFEEPQHSLSTPRPQADQTPALPKEGKRTTLRDLLAIPFTPPTSPRASSRKTRCFPFFGCSRS